MTRGGARHCHAFKRARQRHGATVAARRRGDLGPARHATYPHRQGLCLQGETKFSSFVAGAFLSPLARVMFPLLDGSVSVAVEQQPFNALVQWLASIETEQGYAIDRASIDRGSEEGLVNGQFRFQ